MEVALSDSDMRKRGLNVLLYEQLKGMTPQNLLNSMPVAILYQVTKDEGHWTLLHRTPEGIEFFDPYGIVVDREFKDLQWEQPHYLAKLLEQLSKTVQINYNQYQFQKMNPKINTCGRWVSLRNDYSDLSINRFKKMVDEVTAKLGMTGDEMVVARDKK
jgi:hypothetical protein